jgi:hypothetical protein
VDSPVPITTSPITPPLVWPCPIVTVACGARTVPSHAMFVAMVTLLLEKLNSNRARTCWKFVDGEPPSCSNVVPFQILITFNGRVDTL